MLIDKSWIQKSRVSNEYEIKVSQFLDFAFNNALGHKKKKKDIHIGAPLSGF